MHRALKKDHPDIPFWVQSSTRNFWSQKRIWEAKWKGKRKVDGKKLNLAYSNPVRRGKKILQYSSMPGTSRHHWGTDFDINRLTNGYYRSGNGLKLFRWMKKNAHRWGFCQPYTADRNQGYNEERWHWSYRPTALKYYSDWLRLIKPRLKQISWKNEFAGARSVFYLAPIYVESINPACK